MSNDPTPLTGEEMETAIRELPRDPETVALYKKMAEAGPAAAEVRRKSSNRSIAFNYLLSVATEDRAGG